MLMRSNSWFLLFFSLWLWLIQTILLWLFMSFTSTDSLFRMKHHIASEDWIGWEISHFPFFRVVCAVSKRVKQLSLGRVIPLDMLTWNSFHSRVQSFLSFLPTFVLIDNFPFNFLMMMVTFKMLIGLRSVTFHLKSRWMECRCTSDLSCILSRTGKDLRMSKSRNIPFSDIRDVVVSALRSFYLLAVVAAHGIIITVSSIYFIVEKSLVEGQIMMRLQESGHCRGVWWLIFIWLHRYFFW